MALTPQFNDYTSFQSSSELDKASQKNIDNFFEDQFPKFKSELLKLAKDNVYPVLGKHPLGGFLHHFTQENCKFYDEEFAAQLKSIQPNWVR